MSKPWCKENTLQTYGNGLIKHLREVQSSIPNTYIKIQDMLACSFNLRAGGAETGGSLGLQASHGWTDKL